jgi:hypothetical protein
MGGELIKLDLLVFQRVLGGTPQIIKMKYDL